MAHQSLEERYLDQLRDLRDTERAVAKKLPKLVQTASSSELRRVFEYCLEQTEGHVHHIERMLSDSQPQIPDRPRLRLVQGGLKD